MSIRQISFYLSKYLARELHLEQKESDTIRYGLEIIIGAVIKGLIIIGLSYIFRILPFVLAALATSGLFKLLSGGAHCNTFGRCLIFSIIALLGIGGLAPELGRSVNEKGMILLVLLSTIVGLYAVKKWAPVDTPNKPITKKEKKERYRQLSLLYVFAWGLGITLLIIFTKTTGPFSLVLASIGGLLIQTFSLTPIGIQFTERVDRILAKLVP
ncbi:MAG: accessory gene regulator B family protein [Thermincola sp.]|nr:accessory gene regulator B family protein [Thermincola sp.]MDT3702913.1 accessory gene regulator B family protein [Thermincola sp.]